MFDPRTPTNPTPVYTVTSLATPTAVDRHDTAACACHHITPAPAPAAPGPAARLSPAGVLAVVGAVAVVLVLGTVLVSLLLAVAITAASVTVCAVVLRALLTHSDNR